MTKKGDDKLTAEEGMVVHNSPEIFTSDDQIVNT